MKIEGSNGWLELSRRQEGGFTVSASTGDFAGSNPEVWFHPDEFERFRVELEDLERSRKGEARLVTMSPGELDLVIRIVDSLGHVAVEGVVGRHVYAEHEYYKLECRFGFPIDPTTLPGLLRDVRDL